MEYKLSSFTLEPHDVAEFGRVAAEKRLNKSALLRLLIKDFLDKERKAARADRT